jgi:hypothetical protein
VTGLAWVLTTAALAGETITLFDGKTLDGWVVREPRERNKWVVGLAQVDPNDPATLAVSAVGQPGGQLVNASSWRKGSKEKRDVDIYTAQSFSDCTVRLEFMLPHGGNSGVYMMGEYELQIKDSFGQDELTYQDLGAIYKVAVARVNAARKPGEWQTLIIEFQAPRFKDGVKVANARFVKVTINDQVIHENVELTNVTPGGLTKKEVPAGPILLQGDHSAVAYRNIQITLPTAK